ncbi:MAG: hypothetical protein V1853_01505 [bacterium]
MSIRGKYQDRNIAIQGDRDPSEAVGSLAVLLGQKLHRAGFGAIVGDAGGLVKLIEQSGIPTVRHAFKGEPIVSSEPGRAPMVSCVAAGLEAANSFGLGDDAGIVRFNAHGIRMSIMRSMSCGAVFFAGSEGTKYQLLHFLVRNLKGKGQPIPIALIGWMPAEVSGLLQFLCMTQPSWLQCFEANEAGVDAAVKFLQGEK